MIANDDDYIESPKAESYPDDDTSSMAVSTDLMILNLNKINKYFHVNMNWFD